MSHAKYQTKALIVSSKNRSDSDKLLTVFTERFGLIYVNAQSIRKMNSKMNFHTHKYSMLDLDLVEGRNIWRLTGAHEIVSSLGFVASYKYTFLESYSLFIVRLCAGEEYNFSIWSDIEYYVKQDNESFSEHYTEKEIISLLRMLAFLGYIDVDNSLVGSDDIFSLDNIQEIQRHKSHYLKLVNNSLHNSHL